MMQEDHIFPKRDRLEVTLSILSHCYNTPSKKSHIVYKCNLNFKQLKMHLKFLIDKSFLKVIDEDTYQTTQKGRELIKEYQHIKKLMLTSEELIRYE